ncbi:MAG TPA: DNA topoisomerase, partial [Xanthomonadales bacterium]|nr:DNA topoisomerase [Xanthomonadales bacterium]
MSGAHSHLKMQDFTSGTYAVGRVLNAVSATYEPQRTEPPRRYDQSDLLDAMMAAYKFADNDADRAILKQISGLGTSRTRESIITKMLERGFVETRKARARTELVPTAAGRAIVEGLPDLLTSVAMTAKWELAFQLIEKGKASASDVDRHLAILLNKIVSHAAGAPPIDLKIEDAASA